MARARLMAREALLRNFCWSIQQSRHTYSNADSLRCPFAAEDTGTAGGASWEGTRTAVAVQGGKTAALGFAAQIGKIFRHKAREILLQGIYLLLRHHAQRRRRWRFTGIVDQISSL